jgi:hypothetical protein
MLSRPESQDGAVVDGNGWHTLPPRLSILRSHNHSRSSSSNYVPGSKALLSKFFASNLPSCCSSLSAESRNGVIRVLGLEMSLSLPRRVIHKANSTSIFIGMDERGEVEEAGEIFLVPESASAPPAVGDFEHTSGEVDEEEYGEIIGRPDGASKSPLEELHTDGRLRGSFSASSSSS